MGKNVVDLREADFDDEVLKSKIPVVVDFWAPWCAPCLTSAMYFEDFAAKYGGQAKFVKINFDESKELVNRYNITGIPTFLFFKDGQVAQSSEGFGNPSPKIWEIILSKLV